MDLQMAIPCHQGEREVRRRMGASEYDDDPSQPVLSSQGANLLQQAPLLAIGTVDERGRPWASLWGGFTGFARPLGQSMVGMKITVDHRHDPVVQILCGGEIDGQVRMHEKDGKMMAVLTIDLDRRKRVKLSGKLVAGSLVSNHEGVEDGALPRIDAQLVTRIDQSLGNCPKYLNRKTIEAARSSPKVLFDLDHLPQAGLQTIAQSDSFYLTSRHNDVDMDTNHRGGPRGFVRAEKNSNGNFDIVWPEYSGNRLYQSLGNLDQTPLVGLCFPNFENGDILYVTGNTETLFGSQASKLIPRSNLAVRVKVTSARLVQQSLPFRGKAIEPSPYNPKIRPLASEDALDVSEAKGAGSSATIVDHIRLTPSISRFRFSMDKPVSHEAGQWVALDFSDELSEGYKHSDNLNPRSLNDDYTRTFTVSSAPPPRRGLAENEFEVTIRRVGVVTEFMFRHEARHDLQVPVLGFGGDFRVDQAKDTITPFVASGVGITPLLGRLPDLDIGHVRLFWTIHVEDVMLVLDTFRAYPALAKSTMIFLTGSGLAETKQEALAQLQESGADATTRRMQSEDLTEVKDQLSDQWYICVSSGLQKILLGWLKGKEVHYESFDF